MELVLRKSSMCFNMFIWLVLVSTEILHLMTSQSPQNEVTKYGLPHLQKRKKKRKEKKRMAPSHPSPKTKPNSKTTSTKKQKTKQKTRNQTSKSKRSPSKARLPTLTCSLILVYVKIGRWDVVVNFEMRSHNHRKDKQ